MSTAGIGDNVGILQAPQGSTWVSRLSSGKQGWRDITVMPVAAHVAVASQVGRLSHS